MSRRFVPVVDQEKPRAERNDMDPTMMRHRAFDAPHDNNATAAGRKKTVHRGWAAGDIGWGVQGYFGDSAPDQGESIQRAISTEGLVRDHMGRWVKPKRQRAKAVCGTEVTADATGQPPASMSAKTNHAESPDQQRFSYGRSRSRSPRHRSRSPRRHRSRSRSRSPRSPRSPRRSIDHRRRSRSRSPGNYKKGRSRSRTPRDHVDPSRNRHHSRSRSPGNHGNSRRAHGHYGRPEHSRARSPSGASGGRNGSSHLHSASTAGEQQKKWDPEWGWI